ncbi:MAG: response regulator, partial [Alteromonadaceae bacterium]|nr:response regulator [Alteromonadaceae bacterium]
TTQVFLAENGIQALQILADENINLVVTDIVMPKENGIDLIMDIKKSYPVIPVVAMSGGGGIEGRFNYLEIAKLVGANQILEKPFSAETLRTIVADLMA